MSDKMSREKRPSDSPPSTDTVGNGVEEHAAWISSVVIPAGRNGSATVPVGTGITSEQSVSVD